LECIVDPVHQPGGRDELIEVLDDAVYALPEPADDQRLEEYSDARQLAKNAETCRRIVALMDRLSPCHH
jgi:hypothetical protein